MAARSKDGDSAARKSRRSPRAARLAHDKAIYRPIVEHQPDLIALCDLQGRLLFVNEAYARHAGRPAEALAGTPLFARDADDTQEMRGLLDEALRRGEPLERDFCALDAQGSACWISWRASLQHQPDTTFVLFVGRDVTERKRLHDSERLARQEQQRHAATLRSVTEAIPAMVGVVGPDQRLRFVNGAFARWSGRPAERIVGATVREVLGPALYEENLPWLERALAGERVVFENPPGSRGTDQHLSISYIPLWLDGGAADGFVAVVQDVTQQKREENRLMRLSQRDRLTGLLNRAGLDGYLDDAMRSPGSPGQDIGLLYIDLDHFKPVNDTHGHAVGDELLKLFSRRLSRLVRPTDAVVRLGGDEFAVVLTGLSDVAGMALVAEKIVSMAAQPFAIGTLRVSIGASVGYAIGMDRTAGFTDLMARADRVLYQAKASGRGCAFGAGPAPSQAPM